MNYSELTRLIKAYARKRHFQDEDDLVQEVLMRLFAKSHKYDPSRPFEPYFWRIVHNTYVTLRKRQHSSLNQDIAYVPAEPIEHEIIRLKVVGNYTLTEIAEKMGMDRRKVRSTMQSLYKQV